MADFVSGFAGSVDQIEDALRSPFQGNSTPVVRRRTDLAITASSSTRTVNIAAGTIWAHGVRATFDAKTVTFDAVSTSGQSRWDAVVVRIDWNTATAVVTKVIGVAAASAPNVLPAGLRRDPGDVFDVLLAMVQVTFGVNALPVSSVQDRRLSAHKTLWAPSLAALPAADPVLYGMEALVGAAGVRYRCGSNSSGVASWLPPGSGWQWATQSAVLASSSTFTGTGMNIRGGHNPTTGDVQLDIRLRRNGPTVTPNSLGNFSPDIPVATITAPHRPNTFIPVNGQYRSSSGAWYRFDGIFAADGALTIESGTAGVPMANWPTANSMSMRMFIRFNREV
ncbi:hypothetical protein GCM10009616_35680 [Microlunatus lacustris]